MAEETYIENNPDAARTIDGLRDTGYDFNSACADIIDNSVSAGADKILIRIISDTEVIAEPAPNLIPAEVLKENGALVQGISDKFAEMKNNILAALGPMALLTAAIGFVTKIFTT